MTVIRPAAVVGPGVDSVVTRHFEAPRLLTVKGCDPRWQFCHVDDLVSALEMAALGTVSGVVAVGGEGWLEQEQVEEISGLKRLELPAGLTFGTAQRLHRLGITPAPATDLHYVVYPWVVDCAALRAAGWKPAVDQRGRVRTAPGAARGQARASSAAACPARTPRSPPPPAPPSPSSVPRRSSMPPARSAADRRRCPEEGTVREVRPRGARRAA